MATLPINNCKYKEQCVVISFCWAKDLKTRHTYCETKPVYSFVRSVTELWCKRFSSSKESTADDKRPGRHINNGNK